MTLFTVQLSRFPIAVEACARVTKAKPLIHTMGRLGTYKYAITRYDYDFSTKPDAFGQFLQNVRGSLPGVTFYYGVSRCSSSLLHIYCLTPRLLFPLSHYLSKVPRCHRCYNGLDSPMVNTRNSTKVTMRKASIDPYVFQEWSDKSNQGRRSTPDFDL
jgi:hypothetical protein